MILSSPLTLSETGFISSHGNSKPPGSSSDVSSGEVPTGSYCPSYMSALQLSSVKITSPSILSAHIPSVLPTATISLCLPAETLNSSAPFWRI